MKLLDILNKISEEQTYPFYEDEPVYDEEDNSLVSVNYIFNTPNYPYQVLFNSMEYQPEDKTFDLSFGIDRGYGYKIDTYKLTGEGKVKNILKTVAKIIDDFFNQYGDEGVEKIIINPVSEKHRRVYKALLSELPPNILSKITLK